ncbi:MAG: hypothetical protein WC785_04350 [Tatlockia sp.]|jgi:hypothetical protein
MAKIIFSFGGTGTDDHNINTLIDYEEKHHQFKDDVLRVYVKGCQDKNAGGGIFFPDVNIPADKIRKAFSDDKAFDLDKLKAEFGDSIEVRGTLPENAEITHIGLRGYSRGALAAFATVQKMDEVGIPMDVFANQPVTGQIAKNTPRSLYKKHHDLSDCKHINSANTLLGTYDKKNGIIHNTFHQQMVAVFPETVTAQNWLLPKQSHALWGGDFLITHHTNQLMFQQGYVNYEGEPHEELILKDYADNDLYFTPPRYAQSIMGAENAKLFVDPVYQRYIIKQATRLLDQDLAPSLSFAQASAIVAIFKVESIENKKQLMDFVLQDSPNARKFTKIVNKVQDDINYVSHSVKEKRAQSEVEDGAAPEKKTKDQLIEAHSQTYKKTIYTQSCAYLMKEEPNAADKASFIESMREAEAAFANNALQVDRGFGRQILKGITNFVLHVTGLFLVVNTLHEAKTGDWLLFNETRSTKEMKKTLQEVKNILREQAPEAAKKPDEEEDSVNSSIQNP